MRAHVPPSKVVAGLLSYEGEGGGIYNQCYMGSVKANVTYKNPSFTPWHRRLPFLQGVSNAGRRGGVYDHVATVIGCHMIGSFPLAASNSA